jgi:hypothetical protein
VPDLPTTDCNTISAALTAAALAIAATSLALCALILAWVMKQVHEWRTWRK